jgi:hypothetical protein
MGKVAECGWSAIRGNLETAPQTQQTLTDKTVAPLRLFEIPPCCKSQIPEYRFCFTPEQVSQKRRVLTTAHPAHPELTRLAPIGG